jgi:2-polyprenyl-6-methoxyphenol hydroxylase-like FAD-dependent oxidoreductase
VATLPLAGAGAALTRYPFVLMYPQDEHERFLIERLREQNVDVERPLQLIAFEDRGDRVTARLKRPDGREEVCEADYLAGCDGARSTVREVLGTGFPGGTYEHLFYVADVQASGPVMNGELHVALDQADFLAAFPMKGEGRARLIGTVREQATRGHDQLEWDDVSRDIIERLGIDVKKVNWFSTYHVHHRVAEQFRRGRAFLVGDAAHIHSPVGGQGMNTGLGDAINLAWKLAAVLQTRADSRLLDTYEPERIAFANRLVATTDRAFKLVTSTGSFAAFVRLHIVPLVLPPLFSTNPVRRFMFRAISQTAIDYRDSALSGGAAGRVKAGDRLPWVRLDTTRNGSIATDNFAALDSMDWQVHVYGVATDAIAQFCDARRLALHVFAWRDTMQSAGFARDALYFVRPDGYVGFADGEASAANLQRYLEVWRVRGWCPDEDRDVTSTRAGESGDGSSSTVL